MNEVRPGHHAIEAIVCRKCRHGAHVRREDPSTNRECPKGGLCAWLPSGYDSDPATPRCLCNEYNVEKLRFRPELGTSGAWMCFECLPRTAFERLEQRAGRKLKWGESYEGELTAILDKLETFERAERDAPTEDQRAKDAVDELALCLFASERRDLIDRRIENAKGKPAEVARIIELAWQIELNAAQREGYLARAEAAVHVALVLGKR